MAPSAVSESASAYPAARSTSRANEMDILGSVPLANGNDAQLLRAPALLYPGARDEVHDLVCVGFGPASLAIAVALNDMLQSQSDGRQDVGGPKVRFLERQSRFRWHAGMLLPGAKMQISFIKDLATLRDPCSYFTFLNYLKQHNRLVQFANLGTFLPSRLEFDDYLTWAASHFENVVDYSQEVQTIHPRDLGGTGQHDCFEVITRNVATGGTSSVLTRHVVIAVGGQPSRPPIFPVAHAKILHSSEYNTRIEKVLPDKGKDYTIAIIGSGQSGAEVFNDLHARYPNAKTRLVFRDTALRPSDDSPFVNEVFNPEAVDTFFEQPDDFRYHNLKRNKATNYSVVRLELIEKLYHEMYLQGIRQPNKNLWQHQILPSREITAVVDQMAGEKLELTLSSLDPLSKGSTETLVVDAIVLATGYRRDAHVEMLRGCQVVNGNRDGLWKVGRDYALKLDPQSVDEGVGIWLQGCNEGTHGLADSLLSILATRSGELVHSMFGDGRVLNGH